MIECTHQVVAVFSNGDKAEIIQPVLAWDDKGEPLVLGDKALVLASASLSFQGIRFAGHGHRGPDNLPGPVPVVTKPRERDSRDKA